MEQTCRKQDDQRNRTSVNPLGGRGRGLCFTGKLQRATPGKFDERRHKCMLGRIHHLIFDCPDPRSLARFYSEVLGQPITYDSEDFVVVADPAGHPFCFIKHPGGAAPLSNWPLTPDER